MWGWDGKTQHAAAARQSPWCITSLETNSVRHRVRTSANIFKVSLSQSSGYNSRKHLRLSLFLSFDSSGYCLQVPECSSSWELRLVPEHTMPWAAVLHVYTRLVWSQLQLARKLGSGPTGTQVLPVFWTCLKISGRKKFSRCDHTEVSLCLWLVLAVNVDEAC